MLYLIATPIGNLGDITKRALEVLSRCDYALCEDTRRSRTLLQKYGLTLPLKSFHKFNEKSRHQKVIDDLRSGMDIALLSDAGTPGINDPGSTLIDLCREEKVPYTALPGPSALSMAMSLAGDIPRSQFIGFLSKKKDELESALHYPGVTFFFESPNRIRKTLETLNASPCELILFRELTKLHEEIVRGTPKELLAHLPDAPKGEFVVMLRPLEPSYDDLSLPDHVAKLEADGLTKKEAIEAVAKMRGLPKKIVYNSVHKRSSLNFRI